ncbi:hypothetical protein M1771_00160 [Spiroplasma citri]|uniref:Uncharacterized protein n=1 Tax=Spiroplasma citri TaxID=2133 RepID=A0AAX3SYT9_SPICI|nr:hypothetical protein [Spiroplasma citri]WFG96467.1 hypothetical protein M0C40_00160 [Spiroplasma citri]WFH00361.1 hypothetical protein M1771_00160 [Spiroplasma citri]
MARKRITLIEADKWISRKLLDEDMAQLLVNDLQKNELKLKQIPK